ncbi:universal stress protein [Nocardioides jiangxiensis]|uniref:Universal stress protein n=1 Tax=Nocardioides jiangxiensis TaxID=3064524 RepID=A0ABT9B1K3_9ACTN|nr:universal stress protein [Nocardioides sp. WY-20]MDO7867497.1 universal stress protein [Nocardioides sp. WY-20]
MSTPRPVVVGVDGSKANTPAIDFAADWATSAGVPLELLVVVTGAGTLPPYVASPDPSDHTLLAALAERVGSDHPGLVVSTRIAFGNAVECLVAASATARLTVVGSRGLGTFARSMLGSVSGSLTAHARGPVVVVPPHWIASAHADDDPVVVGVTADPREQRAALRWAFAEATRTSTLVEVVHAVDLAPVLAWDGEGLGLRHVAPTPSDLPALRDAVARQAREFPETPVRVVDEAGHAADVLLQRGAEARLLVVGARHRGLGSVRRAVLHHAEVPVVVVPAPEE